MKDDYTDMMILVTGGSGSGKSDFAENIITELNLRNATDEKCKDSSMYYVATMQVYGEEGEKRVEKHRAKRAGKGFVTIEQQININEIVPLVDHGEEKEPSVLIECMSNLVANEMFSEVRKKYKTQKCTNENRTISVDEESEEKILADNIYSELLDVKNHVSNLVIVTNNVFADGVSYDDSTLSYMRVLALVNEKIASICDEVYEVVAGIPVRM